VFGITFDERTNPNFQVELINKHLYCSYTERVKEVWNRTVRNDELCNDAEVSNRADKLLQVVTQDLLGRQRLSNNSVISSKKVNALLASEEHSFPSFAVKFNNFVKQLEKKVFKFLRLFNCDFKIYM
jgi:hypothetical protein